MKPAANFIPKITNSLGRWWVQPKLEDILMDDKYAQMSQITFNLLHEYSHSRPTGVYPGKMWRATDGRIWWLMWYGPEYYDHCSVEHREIQIT